MVKDDVVFHAYVFSSAPVQVLSFTVLFLIYIFLPPPLSVSECVYLCVRACAILS